MEVKYIKPSSNLFLKKDQFAYFSETLTVKTGKVQFQPKENSVNYIPHQGEDASIDFCGFLVDFPPTILI